MACIYKKAILHKLQHYKNRDSNSQQLFGQVNHNDTETKILSEVGILEVTETVMLSQRKITIYIVADMRTDAKDITGCKRYIVFYRFISFESGRRSDFRVLLHLSRIRYSLKRFA